MVGSTKDGNFNLLMAIDSMLGIIKFLFEIQNLKYILIFLFAFSLTAAFLAGILFSGYFYVLNNALKDVPKFKGEYAEGLKKYFNKVFFLTFKLILFSGFFIIFILVATVPAITSIKAIFTQSKQFTLLSILLSLITLVVTVFVSIFYQVSVAFWLPGIFNNESNPFKKGKQLSDQNFWSIFPKVLLINLVLIIYGCFFVYTKYFSSVEIVGINTLGLLIFMFNWIFETIITLIIFTYIFTDFYNYQSIEVNNRTY
jgi:hypothetical protein